MTVKTQSKTTNSTRHQGGFRPVDVHVGGQLRTRRKILGLSQERLGDRVGLTFQQIQKYENGANRIGASRLYEFAQILDVTVEYFFEGIDDQGRTVEPGIPPRLAKLAPLWERLTVDQADAITNVIKATAGANADASTTH